MERPRWGPPVLFPPQQGHFALPPNQRFAPPHQYQGGILHRFTPAQNASNHRPSLLPMPLPFLNSAPSQRAPHPQRVPPPNIFNQFLRHPSFHPPTSMQQRPVAVLRPRCLPAWFQQKPKVLQPSKSQSSSSSSSSQPKPAQSSDPSKCVSVPPVVISKPTLNPGTGTSENFSPAAPGFQGPAQARSLQDRLQLLTEPSPLQPPPASSPFDIPLPSSPAPKKTIPLEEPSVEGGDQQRRIPLPISQAGTETNQVLLPSISWLSISISYFFPTSLRERIPNISIHCVC